MGDAFANMQRDGHMQVSLQPGHVAYSAPVHSKPLRPGRTRRPGFHSFAEPLEGDNLQVRSQSFADHFSEARQFFFSQTEAEQNHIVAAFLFELSKVETVAVRERMVRQLANVDSKLAERVASGQE